MQLRPSTLKERKQFYEKEFSIKKVKSWFKEKPQFFVVDLGSESGIIKDKRKKNRLFVLRPNIGYKELRKKLIKLMPEDVYYDRNKYKNVKLLLKNMDFKNALKTKNCLGQELAFDIDPENINCPNCGKKRPHKFCPICIKISLNYCLDLKKFLKKHFKNIKIVYSGRGCHLHVRDKKAFKMTIKQRAKLNKKLKKFPIDPWVSHGYIRLIRLPYSLNTLVSRIVMPLNDKEIKNLDPEKERKIMPRFLKS